MLQMLQREYQRKIEGTKIKSFNAFKKNGVWGSFTSSAQDAYAPVNSYGDLKAEKNLHIRWSAGWPVISAEDPEVHPTTTVETESPKSRCEVNGYHSVGRFCKDKKLEQTLEHYVSIACRVYKDAAIALSLSSDPEIEDNEKIKISIHIDTDFDTLLSLDDEYYRAIDILVPDEDRDFFVKTYELAE